MYYSNIRFKNKIIKNTVIRIFTSIFLWICLSFNDIFLFRAEIVYFPGINVPFYSYSFKYKKNKTSNFAFRVLTFDNVLYIVARWWKGKNIHSLIASTQVQNRRKARRIKGVWYAIQISFPYTCISVYIIIAYCSLSQIYSNNINYRLEWK